MPALLIQTSVKATIVLLVAWLLTRAMARCSAAARHLVWAVAIVAALVLPLIQVAAPRWNVPLLPAPAAVAPASASAAAVSDPIDAPPGPVDTPSEHDVAAADAAPAARAAVYPLPASATAVEISWMAAAMAVWIVGLTMALARFAAALAWVSRMVREATDVEDPLWTAMLNEFVAALGIATPVSLKISAEATIPAVCGIRTPTILLPPEAAGWPVERRRVVLLHELAHVARRDCLVHTVAQLARAVHWFNPLAHLAAGRLRAEQERAADDLVLASGTDAPTYADHLFEMARTCRAERDPAWVTLAMARPSQLEGRVMDILDDRRNRQPPARAVRAAVGVAAAALILPVGALQLTAAAGPLPQAAPVMSGSQRVAAGIVLEASQATPAAPALVDAQWHDPRPESIVSAADQSIGVRPDVDVDVDVDDFRLGPNPVPNPRPNPPPPPTPNLLPWAETFLLPFGLNGTDAWQAQAPSQSQDTAVSDETRRRVADALLGTLNDENENVRQQALEALAGMRDPRAIPGLLKASRDPSVRVREQALNALAQFDTPEATGGVLVALKDQSPEVRARAARLLAALGARGRLSDPKYVAAVSGLLKDASPDVRLQAIVALGRMRGREAVPLLLPMLKDMDQSVREQAAIALGYIADPGAIDALTAALKDADAEVREQAARALGRIARGQPRVKPVAPVPPVPPLPPRPPQVNLDVDAVSQAVQRARDALQFDLPDLQWHQQDFEWQELEIDRQQRDIQRQAEELRREAERLVR